MKKVIFSLLFLVPGISSAVSTDWFDRNEINRNVRCPIQICAMNDYGRTYTQTCNELRSYGTTFRGQPVIRLKDERGQSCYCPCDYGYEARARNGGY